MKLEIRPGDAFQKNDGRIYTVEKAKFWEEKYLDAGAGEE